uniref:Uncharacterized protein n=1 Tax=Oryza sativa subsp. japonica TaxID=39947 RepID=Q6K778_ORYSJ|nr:hypothetical protein [Oryza sativa Japonica Group]
MLQGTKWEGNEWGRDEVYLHIFSSGQPKRQLRSPRAEPNLAAPCIAFLVAPTCLGF